MTIKDLHHRHACKFLPGIALCLCSSMGVEHRWNIGEEKGIYVAAVKASRLRDMLGDASAWRMAHSCGRVIMWTGKTSQALSPWSWVIADLQVAKDVDMADKDDARSFL